MQRISRVLLLYLILTFILSWPLPLRIITHVPGVAQWAFDESTFIWNIWYFKHAVVDQLSTPLHSELIYFPLGIDLVLYTYNFYHALMAQPLYLATNLPFASNITLLTSTVLSAFGTYLLTRYLLHRQPSSCTRHSSILIYAPLLAGALYAFATNRAIYAALGHYDMVTTQWIPFYALALLQSLDEHRGLAKRRLSAFFAGIFFAMNGLAEMITAMFMAIFTLVVVVSWLSNRHSSGSSTLRERISLLASSLLLIGVVSGLLWGLALVPILTQFLTNDFSLKGWGEAIPLSADLVGWVTPSVLHPIWGSDLVEELRRVKFRAIESSVTGFRDVNTVFIGWTSLILAVIGAIRYGRRVRIWIWTGLIFGIFTLGPFLQINGQYRYDLDGVEATFPLPYALLHYIPIIKANRAPNRNSVLLMLAVAVLVGYALAWMLSWVRRSVSQRSTIQISPSRLGGQPWPQILTLCITGLILFEHLTVPVPLSDARVPEVYEQIAADPAPVSVMQFPLGWRDSFEPYGPERTVIQYYQSAHIKPMLGGNISRAPDFKKEYFSRLPFFQALRNIQSGFEVDEALRAAAQAQAEELTYLYNVGYVLLFPPIVDRPPYSLNWEASWGLAKEFMPLEASPFWSGDGIEAYRVIQPPGSDEFHIDFGIPGTLAYRGEGWDSADEESPYGQSAIWALNQESRLFIPLRNIDPEATYQVAIQLHPFGYPGATEQQTVGLEVNGHMLATQTVTELSGWQEYQWEVDGSQLVSTLNRLKLIWGWSAVPRQVLSGDRQIGTTGRQLPIDADLKGFAEGGFIALFDEEGNQIDGSAGRNGVNLTVLDPISGVLKEVEGFDTTANVYESQKLAEFIREIPLNHTIVVVSQGSWWTHINQEALEALETVGIDLSIERIQGNYLAAVGVAGAEPGSALVVQDPNEAFLRISLERDRRPLAAAVDWIAISKSD